MARRITVASRSTAAASAKPSIFTRTNRPRLKAANTAIMIAAALVMSPAVRARPSTRASSSGTPGPPAPSPTAWSLRRPGAAAAAADGEHDVAVGDRQGVHEVLLRAAPGRAGPVARRAGRGPGPSRNAP